MITLNVSRRCLITSIMQTRNPWSGGRQSGTAFADTDYTTGVIAKTYPSKSKYEAFKIGFRGKMPKLLNM